MVVPAALSAGRLPAPSARAPRVSMALSLGLHGLAVLLLFAAGAAGSASTSEQALLVELALAAPAAPEADDTANEATPSPAQPTPQSSPQPTPEQAIAIELAPPDEPPPIDVSDLKPVEPPKPKPLPPPPEQKRPTAKSAAPPATPRRAPSHDFGTAAEAQQAAAGFLAAPAIVWEGKPRYRHPPTPAVYPPRAIELNQQGEAVGRVRLGPAASAVRVVLVCR